MITNVAMIEQPSISIDREKNTAMIGIDSEVGGVISDTMPRNTVTERRFVICSVIFSPHSGGIVKPSTLLMEIRIDGTIQFKP